MWKCWTEESPDFLVWGEGNRETELTLLSAVALRPCSSFLQCYGLHLQLIHLAEDVVIIVSTLHISQIQSPVGNTQSNYQLPHSIPTLFISHRGLHLLICSITGRNSTGATFYSKEMEEWTKRNLFYMTVKGSMVRGGGTWHPYWLCALEKEFFPSLTQRKLPPDNPLRIASCKSFLKCSKFHKRQTRKNIIRQHSVNIHINSLCWHWSVNLLTISAHCISEERGPTAAGNGKSLRETFFPSLSALLVFIVVGGSGLFLKRDRIGRVKIFIKAYHTMMLFASPLQPL